MATRLLTPAGLFALALLVRLLPWPTVFEPGRVVFFGMDAWYHMRRAQLALASGWPPAFDPYLNFPHGGMPIWPPLFDAVLAAWVWPGYAAGDLGTVEALAALLPPLLGALCVVVLYRMAASLFDRAVAVVGGVILCFLSSHFWYSQLGFVDHHAATALVATGLLAATVRLLTALDTGQRAVLVAAQAGGLAGLALAVWPGTVLHVGLAAGGLVVWCVTRDAADAAARGALAMAVFAGVALAVVLPFTVSVGWPGERALSPTVLSWFQPWLLACGAAVSAGCALLWRRPGAGAARPARAAQLLGAGAVLVGASAILVPAIWTGLADAVRWLTRDEVFQGLVKESKPLFEGSEGFDVENAELRLSRWLYLFPFVWVWWWIRARRAEARPALLLVAAWAVVLFSVTVLQRRFFNSLSPVYALGIAVVVVDLWRAVPGWLAARPGLRWPSRAAVVLATLLLLAPTFGAYRIPATNWLKRQRGESMMVPKNEISRRVLLQTADWIRTHTPPTQGPLDPAAHPEYGVLAPWGYGHLLKYVARRPTVVGNFGDDVGEANLRRTTAYFRSREGDAVRILDDLRARYVLVNALGDVPRARLEGESMHKRLSHDDSPGLRHHRLVYESPLDARWAAIGRSEFRVFERVEGARLTGRAAPGAEVVASLGYTSNRGRRGRFESRTRADARGRYEIRVPYATRGGPPGLEVDPQVRVSAGGRAVRVPVAESAVREGATVPVPDLV